jgi:TPR repeat protein
MFDNAQAKVAFLNGEYERAAEMFHEGARDGDIEAAFHYGYCLMHGYGTRRNEREARSFFSFARELDGGEAAYNLASLYISGLGGAKDFHKAVTLMSTAAEKGCVEAQLYLGMVYTLGVIIDPDIVSISLIPYHKPEYRSDVLLLEGEVSDDPEREEEERASVVRQNPQAAFEYFRAAARHDPTYVEDLVSKGKYMYAKCYADGFGVDFNLEKSTTLVL